MSEVTVDSRYFKAVMRSEAKKVLAAFDLLAKKMPGPSSKRERAAYELVVRRLKQWGPQKPKR